MVALLGAGALVLVPKTTAREYLQEMEWPIAAHHGKPIVFRQVITYGFVVTSPTLTIAWVYVWLRYHAFAGYT